MNTDFSRRGFLGMLGLAGGVVIAPSGLFAAISGERKLRFGVVSDVHLQGETGELHKWRRALEHFRDQKVDAVVVAGDIANTGRCIELRAFAKTWYEVFPNDCRPDGGKVERVFGLGNHDCGIWQEVVKKHTKDGVLDRAGLEKEVLYYNRERLWKELFNEEYAHFYAKDVKGYRFLVSHWRASSKELKPPFDFEPVELPVYLKEHAAELGKKKPFFFVQHLHPKGTCHGPDAWWPDSGKNTTDVLKDFPNAVCFSGHSHRPLTDERAVWQGAFTSFGTGSLSYCSPLGWDPLQEIRMTASAPEGFARNLSDGNCNDGYVVDVHEGFLAVRRMEFTSGRPLGDDWIVPVPVNPAAPEFAFAPRMKRRPPNWKTPPKTTVERVTVKKDGKPVEKVRLSFPAVKAERGSTRVYAYEITARKKDGTQAKVVMVRTAGCDMPPEFEPETVICDFPSDTTFLDDADIDIVPFDSFRTRADRGGRRTIAIIGNSSELNSPEAIKLRAAFTKKRRIDIDVFGGEGADVRGILNEIWNVKKPYDVLLVQAKAEKAVDAAVAWWGKDTVPPVRHLKSLSAVRNELANFK